MRQSVPGGFSGRWLAPSSPSASPDSAPLRPPHTAAPPASASDIEPFQNRASSKSPVSSERIPRTAPPRASTPCSFLTPRSSPRAASGRLASSAVLVVPGASALVPRLCSLVAPAGSLDAAPYSGKRQLSFVSLNKLRSTSRTATIQRLKKEVEQRRG